MPRIYRDNRAAHAQIREDNMAMRNSLRTLALRSSAIGLSTAPHSQEAAKANAGLNPELTTELYLLQIFGGNGYNGDYPVEKLFDINARNISNSAYHHYCQGARWETEVIKRNN